MSAKNQGCRLAPLLALAAAGAFGAGLGLERPWSHRPRLAVLRGAVLLDGRPARAGERLRVGAVLEAPKGGSAALLWGEGASLTLPERTKLAFLGRSRKKMSFRLEHGQALAKLPAAGEHLELSSDLGFVQGRDAAFELYAAARPTGAAADTPRIMRLAVGRGEVWLFTAGAAKPVEVMPAGTRAEVVETHETIFMEGRLLASEWQRLTGRVPKFADPKLPAAEVPPGVWVPRWPGRNGPTPGSRARVKMAYSRELGGGYILGEEKGTWCYDALRDRWRRAGAPQSHPAAPRTPPPSPRCGEGTVAYSPGTYLYYGRMTRACTTWVGPLRQRESFPPRSGAPWEPDWKPLTPPPAANPPPRSGHALYYDPLADLFVVYGGQAQGRAYGDVWVLRLPRARPLLVLPQKEARG